MAQKKNLKPDDTLKTFWRNKYRFADIFNYMFFDGKEIIHPEKLSDHDTNEANILWNKQTKAVSLSRTRDLIKEYNCGMNLILIGIEDQMKVHYAMPVRTMLYDALEYLKQCKELEHKHRTDNSLSSPNEFLSGLTANDRIQGTITLILYYGEEQWDGPQSLSDMLNVPVEFKQFVNDYHVYILDVKHTNTEQFHNKDNRDLFAMLQDFTSGEIEHTEFVKKYINAEIYWETLAAFVAITGKETLATNLINQKGGEAKMYKTWERWDAELREEGRQEGIQAFILDYLEEGFSEERILEKLQKRFSLTSEKAQEYFEKYAFVK